MPSLTPPPTGSQQLPSCPAPSLHFLPTVPVVHSPQLLFTSPHFACRMPPRQECQFCEDMRLSGAATRKASKEQALSKCLWCLKTESHPSLHGDRQWQSHFPGSREQSRRHRTGSADHISCKAGSWTQER